MFAVSLPIVSCQVKIDDLTVSIAAFCCIFQRTSILPFLGASISSNAIEAERSLGALQ
jgi:hypothetical protein